MHQDNSSSSRWGLFILCATTLLLTAGSVPSFTQQVDQPAPQFELPDQAGKTFKLSNFRGKVVLLDFWATWCGPCRQTMPHVQRLHELYKDKGLKVIGINIEGVTPRGTEFLQAGKFSFMVLYDQGNWNSQMARLYGVRSIPHTFLIDRKGNLRFRGHPLRLTEASIESLLNEKAKG